MNPSALEKELRKGRVRPAYLLAGSEPLLRDEALASIRGHVLDTKAEDFNLDQLSGQSTRAAALVDSTRALPIMAPHRLVILTEPERKRGDNAGLTEALVEVVADLATQAQTVLVVVAAKADKRSRWVKAFAEPSVRIECDPPKGGRSVTAFVKQEAGRQGLELEGGAAELLSERIGPQLLMLRQEIAKAALMSEDGKTLTRAHVQATSSLVAEEPIWDLTDAIGAGRSADAVAMLSRLRASGAAAPAINATLAGHFRKLAKLKGGGEVGGNPYVIKKLDSQAKRFTQKRLLGCLRAIHETDTALKGAGQLGPDLSLEGLVIELSS
jgi:DNA polymerase-3 subunit delta